MAPTKTPCPNPLFVLWLAEWKRQARDKLKTDPSASWTKYLTLKRAHAAMQDYPYPLATGLDARCVTSIGDTTASRLQKRLDMHRACQASTSTPESPSSHMPGLRFAGVRGTDQKVRKCGYQPRRGSPQYAMLLALREGKQPMTKASIVKVAGKFQYTAPTEASFLGWSKAACLLRDGLVRRDGNLYALTENGAAVADRLVAGRLGVRDGDDVLKTTPSNTAAETELEKDQRAKIMAVTGQRKNLSSSTHDPDSRACPQGIAGPSVLRMSGSCEASFVPAAPLCPLALGDVDNGTIAQAADPASAGSSFAPWQKPSFVDRKLPSRPIQKHAAAEASTSQQTTAFSCPPGRRASFGPVAPEWKSLGSETKIQGARTLAESAVGDLSRSPAVAAASPTIVPQRSPPRRSSNSVPRTLPPDFNPIALRAGRYDVVCLVDTREVAFGQDRMYISSELSRLGVRCELRQLELGDVIWVARDRRTGGELVLDFVVERKRTEDLVLSVMNGRFADQRHRLIHSGAGSKFYIVEKSAVRVPHEPNMIYSIMAKLQVRDGLTVKRTTSTDDTIAYIERLTRHVKESLQGRDVLGIPGALLRDRLTFLETKRRLAQSDPGNTYHVTFELYQHLNSKNRQLTLGDLFTRFLACVEGVGPSTARKVAMAYKTPRGLMEAFDALETREAKEAMLSHIGRRSAVVGREIGPVLSKKMAEVWTRKTFAVAGGNPAESAAQD